MFLEGLTNKNKNVVNKMIYIDIKIKIQYYLTVQGLQ